MSRTLLPFLYQTRTLRHAFQSTQIRASLRSFRKAASRAPDGRPSSRYSIPFEHDIDAEPSELVAEDPDSTITPTEKRIFGEIFADIERRGYVPRAGRPSQPIAVATDDATQSIVQQLRGIDVDGGEDLLKRYPPTLRGAAKKALRLHTRQTRGTESSIVTEGQRTGQEAKVYSNSQRERDIAAKRKEKQAKLERAMRECKTDKDLWDLLERDVFTLPKRLGLVADSEDKAPLDMDVHGPVYAAALLTATKLLGSNHFGRPSPLVFNIRPRIEELGLTAYVLGVSTALYNAWIALAWRLRGDLQGVTTQLKEMEHNGLGFDRQTLRVLEEIEDALRDIGDGWYGPFAKALMDVPEYDPAVRSLLSWWTTRLREAMGGKGEFEDESRIGHGVGAM